MSYRDRGDRGGGGYSSRPLRVSLVVRNLPLDIRAEDIRSKFEKYGELKDVYIPRDYYTQRPRGFGFVEYKDTRDAEDALNALDRSTINGREISVTYSREGRKTPRDMMRIEAKQKGHDDRYDDRYDDRDRRDDRRRSRSRSPRRRYSRSPRRYSRSPRRSRSYSRERDRGGRERERDRDRERERDRSPERERSRERERDRSPERERSREREYSRERERDYDGERGRERSPSPRRDSPPPQDDAEAM